MYSKLDVFRPTLLSIVAGLTIAMMFAAIQTAHAQPDAATDQKSPVSAGYDGGFFIDGADGDFRIGLGGRVQPQLRLRVAEDAGTHELEQLGFRIRRARLKIDGHAFTPRLTYQFQPEFAGESASLLDYFVNYELFADILEGRVGQWRYPFLRQEITSSGSLMLVDRSIIGNTFGDGFDTGVAVHNGYKAAPTVSWIVGVFNGSTSELGGVTYDSAVAPSRLGPAVVARAAYNHGDIEAYSEADIEGGPLRFSVGGAVSAQPGVDRPGQSELKATLDYIVKVHGFSSSGAAVMGTVQEGEGIGDQELVATGYFVQAGYLIGELVQPAVRYSQVHFEPSEEFDLTGDWIHEGLAGVNLFFYGHKLKWQTDAGVIVTDSFGRTHTDVQARTQLQLSF